MKKNLLVGLIGLGVFTVFAANVKAETVNLDNISETGKNVIVGDVTAPVYSVDIEWGDMTFDYKYDDVNEQYYWREKIECEKLVAGLESNFNNNELDLYYDNACENEMPAENFDFDTALTIEAYYARTVGGMISIHDSSQNGSIIPSISWTSESNYDFVDANFYYEGPVNRCASIEDEFDFNNTVNAGFKLYTDSNCTLSEENDSPAFESGKYYHLDTGAGWHKMTGNILTEDMAMSGDPLFTDYLLKVELVNNPEKTIKTPVKGDNIGTITISIDAK